MRVVLIGSVRTTQVMLEKLIEHGLDVVGVFGLNNDTLANVSGFVDLQPLATSANIPFYSFTKINNHVDEITALKPDIVFVVGLSQMVSTRIIESASKCCVGFHPTDLPKGRGRAPLAWLILEKMNGAACFFRITEQADAGELFSKTPFEVSINDDARSVRTSLYAAMRSGLDAWLPELAKGELTGEVQNEAEATWFGVRREADGVIDWDRSSDSVARLVKAATEPHPGAITYCDQHIIKIWEATGNYAPEYKGVAGSILLVDEQGFVVCCGEANVLITRYSSESDWQPRVGQSLKFNVQSELYYLRKKIEALEAQIRMPGH